MIQTTNNTEKFFADGESAIYIYGIRNIGHWVAEYMHRYDTCIGGRIYEALNLGSLLQST